MTEEIGQRFIETGRLSTLDAVEAMYSGQVAAVAVIKGALKDIADIAEIAAPRLGQEGRLIYVGAGTSGRLATQDGAELGPTFGWPQERTLFCIAGGVGALTVSAEGAEDNIQDGTACIQSMNAGPDDVVLCITASGETPYTVAALKAANTVGALTIGISNNKDTSVLRHAQYGLLAQTGGELVAGSTRMKAGTAQKAILNMLSTAIMMQLGRVYNGYMVDMVVSNAKLEIRATNMIRDIANCSLDVAKNALEQADKNIKLGVLIAKGNPLSESQLVLQQANGILRDAIQTLDDSEQ